MDVDALSKTGILLAQDLEELSKSYNVRSDAHDILGYEAATVRAEALDLINDTGVPKNIKESTLLSAWGNTLAGQIPEMAIRVSEFHRQYRDAQNT